MTEPLRLTNALTEVMKKEFLGVWLQTPNEAFDRLKPLEVIDRGEGDRIWSMIYFLRSACLRKDFPHQHRELPGNPCACAN